MSQTTRREKYLWFTGPIRWPKPKLARLYNYQLGRMTSNGIEWTTTKNAWVLREEGNETEVYIRKLCWFGCRIYNCVFRYFRNGIYRCGNIVVRFRISFFEQKIKNRKKLSAVRKRKRKSSANALWYVLSDDTASAVASTTLSDGCTSS